MSEIDDVALRRQSWKQDPEGVQRSIVEAATRAFAEKGFDATRIDDIAAQTDVSKRMIYYYFGDKHGLYERVLAAAYEKVGLGEAQLDFDALRPVEALEKLVGFMWDHNKGNPDFVRLVMNENLHNAASLHSSREILGIRPKAVSGLARIYERGVKEGVFRNDVDPLKLRFFLSGIGFFNVSNRPSFTAVFGDRLFQADEQTRLRQMLIDMILGYVMTKETSVEPSISASKFPKINPQLHSFLDIWNGKWAVLPLRATAADRRKRFEVIAAEMRLETPNDVDCDTEHWVDCGANPVRVRVFRNKTGGVQPCLIYMHGGAWMQGSPETHWDITSRLASWANMTVISVDYAKAPEIPFPTAIDQCKAVGLWVHENCEKLGIDKTRISVGGDSAGGNLAAALALDLRDSPVCVRGQLLIYPACDFDHSRPSFIENADGPLIQVAGMDRVNAMYVGPEENLVHPRAAPLHATSHQELPPAYIAVAEFDPLRDSGVVYAEALRNAGVAVELEPGAGLIHGYLRAMEYCTDSEQSLRKMAAWLIKLNG